MTKANGIKLQARCEREPAAETVRQVNVDVVLGEETSVQFCVDFFLECDDVKAVGFFGLGIGSENNLGADWDNIGTPVPDSELRDFLVAEARKVL